jgi:hypothetical protein
MYLYIIPVNVKKEMIFARAVFGTCKIATTPYSSSATMTAAIRVRNSMVFSVEGYADTGVVGARGAGKSIQPTD